MRNNAWQNVSYLDAMRPDPGWRVEHAVVATYSLDLVAVVAAMLALAGLDDEKGSGSKVDFANAHERLRGRFRILTQMGRVAVPSLTLPILAIVDQFVREIPSDEREYSWHPKAAFVKLKSKADSSIEWRLWIGSRNLTRDMSWDTGLILVASGSNDGQSIPGVSELAAELYRRADLPGVLPDKIAEELSLVRWNTPPGITIQEIRLLQPDSPERGFPLPPDGISQLLVVSPFLDGGAVKYFGTWGNESCDRWLLSTQDQLEQISLQSGHPLKGYSRLFILDAPDQEPGDPGLSGAFGNGEPIELDDQEPEPRGLHAKIVAARIDEKWILWLGSANSTARGWKRNFEIVVCLTAGRKEIDGLLQLFNVTARFINEDSLQVVQKASRGEEDLLEKARKLLIAEWSVVQKRTLAGPVLKASSSPPLGDSRIALRVGLLGTQTYLWPKEDKQLQLPPILPSAETELAQFVLSLGDLEARWIQRVHDLADREKHFTVRCHTAMPFIDGKVTSSEAGKAVERPLRTDEMRRAFNSPFMPHVLVTTSVGQEGLDFHPWCKTLVHWDISNNPVDIEQREGRIQRYAGLAVRRELAKQLGNEALKESVDKERSSPWREVADLAEKRFNDESGLAPWWSFGGANIDRYVLDVPTSEQRQRLLDLKEQRFLYRLALGQPNQEDFVDLLRRNPAISNEALIELIPRLSAWAVAK